MHVASVMLLCGRCHNCVSWRCRAGANGWQPLPGEPTQGQWAVEVKQQQRADAKECERLLMETYGKLRPCAALP